MIITSRAPQQYQRHTVASSSRPVASQGVTLSSNRGMFEDVLSLSETFARSTLGVGTISGGLGALMGYALTGSLQGAAGGAGVAGAMALSFKALDFS